LRKGGTSSTKDRTKILKRVIKAIGPEKIRVFLADREFIGEEWFRFLIEKGILFVIRIKQNSMVEGIRQGYSVPVSTLVGKLGRRKAIENYPIIL
jgi:hypothetical protein